MNKLKVIFCTDGIFPMEVGGMQRHSRLLIEEFIRTGEVEIVVLHPHKEKVFATSDLIKEEYIAPIDKSKNYLLECYRYSKRVQSVLLKYPNHIIYSQGLSVWYNVKHLGKRLIVNPHGLEPYQSLTFKEKLKAIPFRMIFNHLFRHASTVVSLGGKLTDILKSNVENNSKIVELANAVQLPSGNTEKKFKDEQLNLLFVARFAHNKGIHILLEAIKQLNEEGYSDKLHYHLGGKGPLFEHYSTNFKYKNVSYLGFVSDDQLMALYSDNDLFVFPTLFEGMPTVVLEAMSYAMPVIVSDVGATAELVNPTNGYLITKNDVNALKLAILDFYKLSMQEKQRLSVNARKHVENNYTWPIVAKKHIELFRSMTILR